MFLGFFCKRTFNGFCTSYLRACFRWRMRNALNAEDRAARGMTNRQMEDALYRTAGERVASVRARAAAEGWSPDEERRGMINTLVSAAIDDDLPKPHTQYLRLYGLGTEARAIEQASNPRAARRASAGVVEVGTRVGNIPQSSTFARGKGRKAAVGSRSWGRAASAAVKRRNGGVRGSSATRWA